MSISDSSCDRLIALVASYTGLNIHDRDVASFRTLIQHQMDQLNLPSVDAYYQWLERSKGAVRSAHPYNLGNVGGSDRALSPWQRLLSQLTVGESYFFRDHKQFSLLKNQLIPELLHCHGHGSQQDVSSVSSSSPSSSPSSSRSLSGETAHLRLWSAGCATGEEAYSLAIMMQELAKQNEAIASAASTTDVVGTDINIEFLAKARQGRYGEWSFRQTVPSLRQHYFQPSSHNQWQVNPAIQQRTHFLEFNLVQDDLSHLVTWGRGFDLIVCRNVFIYFTPVAIAKTLATFYQSLNPGGYLLTGHAELQGIPLSGFQVRCFPESIVYQRPLRSRQSTVSVPTLRQSSQLPLGSLNAQDRSQSPLSPQSTALPGSPLKTQSPGPIPRPSIVPVITPRSPMSSRSAKTDRNDRAPSLPGTTRAPTPNPSSPALSPIEQRFADTVQRAQRYANVGNYDEARRACEAAIALKPFAIEPCYLLASIAEETDDLDGAKVFLKRVIYLDEMAVAAYLELAALYDRTGEGDRATKLRRSALKVLAKLPSRQTLPTCDNMTVTELRLTLNRQIADSEG